MNNADSFILSSVAILTMSLTSRVFFQLAASWITTGGGLLLVFASAVALINTSHLVFLSLFNIKAKSLLLYRAEPDLDRIRLGLGNMITLSLELLVAADVVDTLTKPVHEFKLELLYKIGAVVAIRTTLAYFLGKELEEVEKRLELKHKESHKNSHKD